MKKNIAPCFFLLITLLFIYSCKKEIKATQICLHDSSINYMRRWAILTIQTDVYADNGAVKSSKIIYPNGYFQINSDFTYVIFSDDAPVNGKWSINSNCQFVLNTPAERDFSVIQLSDDSLTLRQKVGLITTTQRYVAFTCPNLPSLQFRWDNLYTLQAPYGPDTVFKAKRLTPSGYYKFNPDASYNILNNGVATDGTWGIDQAGCLLVLDNNKPAQRSYEVQKLTVDSLVIWRKDTVAKLNLLQHFFKHK